MNKLLTYPVILSVGIAAACLLTLARVRAATRAAAADALLAALLGALIGGRLAHVAFNWAYFQHAPAEIWNPAAGGLGWHGALAGGLLAGALMARVRRVPFAVLLAAAAPALGVLTLAGWLGCATAFGKSCGYGALVDNVAAYPPLLVIEGVDDLGTLAPRANTYLLGAALAALTLAAGLLPRTADARPECRFWRALLLLALGMGALGFVRGDSVPLLAGLRADQWADALVALVSAAALLRASPTPR